MITLSKSLFELTAAELMKRPVVTIPDEALLKDAAQVFRREQISGAPVVNQEGRCVGILSATDFMRWAQTDLHQPAAPEQELLYFSDWQMIDVENLPCEKVRCHMARDLVTAKLSATIAELALRMLDAHIHRIVVVDAGCRPIGIVSSTDILAAVAYHDGDGAEAPVARPN